MSVGDQCAYCGAVGGHRKDCPNYTEETFTSVKRCEECDTGELLPLAGTEGYPPEVTPPDVMYCTHCDAVIKINVKRVLDKLATMDGRADKATGVIEVILKIINEDHDLPPEKICTDAYDKLNAIRYVIAKWQKWKERQ